MLYTHPTQALRRVNLPLLMLLAMATLLALSGCAHDTEKMQAQLAESTLIEAELADADQLAANEFNEARETVNAAMLAVEEREWDDALEQGQLGQAQAALSLYRAEKLHAQKRFDAVVYGPED